MSATALFAEKKDHFSSNNLDSLHARDTALQQAYIGLQTSECVLN